MLAGKLEHDAVRVLMQPVGGRPTKPSSRGDLFSGVCGCLLVATIIGTLTRQCLHWILITTLWAAATLAVRTPLWCCARYPRCERSSEQIRMRVRAGG
ncbi:hypothetical protein FKP32DRAFT_1148451 [Trametes sanguinea]|nr:hypothetical protein FKP32DRAFT_1148451 [Trametes sanguinea]